MGNEHFGLIDKVFIYYISLSSINYSIKQCYSFLVIFCYAFIFLQSNAGVQFFHNDVDIV